MHAVLQAATPGCTKEACAFRDSYGKFKDAGAEVFGISSDSVEANSDFAKVPSAGPQFSFCRLGLKPKVQELCDDAKLSKGSPPKIMLYAKVHLGHDGLLADLVAAKLTQILALREDQGADLLAWYRNQGAEISHWRRSLAE